MPAKESMNRHSDILFTNGVLLFCIIGLTYLLWPSNPELAVGTLRLDRLQINTHPKASIDLTLRLTVWILDQALYLADYDSVGVAIGYRGKQLGLVTSDGSDIKPNEKPPFPYVNATLQLDRVEVLTDVPLLNEDLERGEITFDLEAEIGGKLHVFFSKRPVKGKSKCEVIINTNNNTISDYICDPV